MRKLHNLKPKPSPCCVRSMILPLLLFLLPILQSTAYASNQQKGNIKISGVVMDEMKSPLLGVNISIAGTTTGTMTDIDGQFTLEVPSDKSVLHITYVGFVTQDITVGKERKFDIVMIEDTKKLEEVVIVGYGTQKKTSVTGSVATVTGETLKGSPVTNLSNSMLGRLPGVIGFTRSGEPGYDGTVIRVRGANTLGDNNPLIVIDGIPDRAGGFDRLNPNEIESVSVLKDASAAIYGSRAANGVILITTKRGKEGKPQITYTGNMGLAQPTRLPEMCDAVEYATLINEIKYYRGESPTYTDDDLRMFGDGSDPWGHPNTDWYDVGLKKSALVYRHDINITGGNEQYKFYVNLAANGQDGFYKNSATRYDQYSIRANIDAKINKYVSLTYGTLGRFEYRQFPNKSASSVFSALRRSKPTLPAFWPTGEPGPDIEYGDNPAVTGTDATGYDRDKRYYIQNNLQLNASIPGVEGLKLVANAAYDKYFRFRKAFRKPWILYSWDGGEDHVLTPSLRGYSAPELFQENHDETNWLLSGIVMYDRTFGAHTVGATVGIEGEKKGNDNLNAFRKYFISDVVDQMFAGGDKDKNNGGSAWEEARLNYFGRFSYNYLERYLVEFVWRYDGSFRFPKGKRYGFFPGFSAAWRGSEETFWKENIRFIDYFKLRGSISQTGNDRIANYQFLNTYGFGSNFVFGDDEYKTLYPIRVPNPNITWEKGTTYNVGLDFKFLENKLSWESDAFYHKRTQMLIKRNASIPETSGMELPEENIGEMCNRGFESMISYTDRAGDFYYDLSFNMTYAKNKILFWDETPGAPSYQQSTGRPIWTGLYYVADGVFNNQAEVDSYPHWNGARPGDIKFVDVNGDGKIDAEDRVRRDKNYEPRFVGGFTANLRWKQWDMSLFFQGATGAEVYVQTWSGEVGNFLKEFYDQRWTEDNPNVEHPRVYNREQEYWITEQNTYFLRPMDYFRLKNAEIGYTFPAAWMSKAGISHLRLYMNASNLFTVDKLKVIDPEAENKDAVSYPQSRIFNFGATITF